MDQFTARSTFGCNVKQFGAVGDGVTDDTAAIQAAIDAAGIVQGGVWFPPGTYQTARLQARSHVALIGTPTWSYIGAGGTVLHLCDAQASCLLDLTGTTGVRVTGLSLDGVKLGEATAGIFIDGAEHEQEETLVIDNTRIANFTGDGITLLNIWAYTVRDCMMIFNGGNGLTTTGWDGYLFHNIINNSRGYGMAMLLRNGANTIIGHRIEWNDKGGIFIENGGHYTITDTYFDYNGGPALLVHNLPENPKGTFAITGNLFNRNGAKAEPGNHQSAHCSFAHVGGLVMTGNTLRSGKGDGDTGRFTPDFGIVYQHLTESIIRDNTLYRGAVQQLIVDLGGNDEQTIVRENVGSLQTP
jgi:hypothetical protein